MSVWSTGNLASETMHSGKVIDKVKNYEIIDCDNCGFIHINPVPSSEELNRIYRQEYYLTEKPQFIERQREDIEWWNVVFDERYDFFEKNLPRNRRRILDVGCGPGFFLKRGEDRGWEVLGIEPSSQAAAHSRELGLKVVEDFLTVEAAAGLGTFDVVHMHEVLEHIPDPKGMLLIANKLLSRGSLICVIVPNDYNPFQKILSEKLGFEHYWVAPPHHINYFSFDSLSRLLESCGFEVVLSEATFPIDMFLLMGENYVGNDKVGRACHAKRKQFEINLSRSGLGNFKKELYQFFASRNIGREIVLFAKK